MHQWSAIEALVSKENGLKIFAAHTYFIQDVYLETAVLWIIRKSLEALSTSVQAYTIFISYT